MVTSLSSPERQLARRTRERFVAELAQHLASVGVAVRERLTQLLEQTSSVREMQERRDAWTLFQSHGRAWEDGTAIAWKRAAFAPATTPTQQRPGALSFELVGDDVVENGILASRMGAAVREACGSEYTDLCARIQSLEEGDELAPGDVLRPEALTLAAVDQWAVAGLPRVALPAIADVLQRALGEHTRLACQSCNAFLVACGVMPSVDLRTRVKRSDSAGGSAGTGASPGASGARAHGGHDAGADSQRGPATAQPLVDDARRRHLADGPMVAVTSPLARARKRAQGVLQQLRRVLSDHTSGFDPTVAHEISPTLKYALSRGRGVTDPGLTNAGAYISASGDYTPAAVERVAGALREHSNELKRKASTTGEKATIEIVALMFQSILAEERIPPSVRVWFARLQLPVLRVALAEPEFFGTLSHPARQLIDRMGSCVMGFDATAINGSALEAEIRRVVQVIEQYPETGRRVFQLVYDEFQKFLSKYLTEKGATLRVVSVAQQNEQKETLTIQYTIELRNMLKDIPVRDEVREFLFKVWADVLAIAAVRKGPQDEETVALKRSAADLVWAASAKPNRSDRARVIQTLPQLLQRLRQGMTLIGMSSPDQEQQIKRISDTLADAFMSKTEAIPHARIEMMAARLANLEDFVSDESMGDLPLDAESIELMLGIDASSIDVIPDAGAKPSEAMMAWVQELHLGHWFTLDHNQKISQVQFAWRSERKQLHLFASMDGRSYLIQAKRLAAYLQAGLLVPQEEEALTLRATRQALEKLDANPERLLAA